MFLGLVWAVKGINLSSVEYFDGFWMSWKIYSEKNISCLGISDRPLIMFGVAIASVYIIGILSVAINLQLLW